MEKLDSCSVASDPPSLKKLSKKGDDESHSSSVSVCTASMTNCSSPASRHAAVSANLMSACAESTLLGPITVDYTRNLSFSIALYQFKLLYILADFTSCEYFAFKGLMFCVLES